MATMKIFPCKSKGEREFNLTWKQITCRDGIYEAEGNPLVRFVTVIGVTSHGTDSIQHGIVFFITGEQLGVPGGWEDKKFRRRDDEKLCAEVCAA